MNVLKQVTKLKNCKPCSYITRKRCSKNVGDHMSMKPAQYKYIINIIISWHHFQKIYNKNMCIKLNKTCSCQNIKNLVKKNACIVPFWLQILFLFWCPGSWTAPRQQGRSSRSWRKGAATSHISVLIKLTYSISFFEQMRVNVTENLRKTTTRPVK